MLDGDGRVAGIVSQTDLLRKSEYQEDPDARRPPLSHHRVQADGLTAGDAMSTSAITVGPDASVVAAARALDRQHIGHLVVTEADGSVVGVISPRDLLKVYLRPDAEIREEIIADVIIGYLGTNPARVRVTVTEGIVHLSGEVEHKSMVPLAARMARAIDGVVEVRSDLVYAIDESRRPLAGAEG